MASTGVGNPYVESSDLVANYPGVSETLAERIDVVGVNPFADAAARTTAIPSPVEGQMSSLSDTDSVERYDGSAWVAVGKTPGLNLISPSSIANSGGSASASGGEVTFTGVTSVSLNGVFSSDYDNYKILLRTKIASGNVELQSRMRLSGTDATTNYNTQYIYATATSVGAGNNSTTYAQVAYVGASNWNLSDLTISGPALAESTAFICPTSYMNSASNVRMEQWFGLHTTATAYDGITFTVSGSSVTGKLRVYGYKNS